MSRNAGKRAIRAVSQSGSSSGQASSSQTHAPGGFGPNEWLVEELYQQYLADKNSVDTAWWDFFQDYQAGRLRTRASNGGSTPAAPPANGAPPAPAPAPATAADRVGTRGRRRPRGPTARRPPTRWPRSRRRPGRAHRPARRGQARRASPRPTKPASTGADVTTLKGPAARVVTNMEASLAVPTATSVRAVPAKLLIDNRTVINNAPAARPRRQGLLHPPDRLRRRQGARRRCRR